MKMEIKAPSALIDEMLCPENWGICINFQAPAGFIQFQISYSAASRRTGKIQLVLYVLDTI